MSFNEDLAALVEKSRQRFSRLSASAGERLFSPRITRSGAQVNFASPLPGRSAGPGSIPDAGVGDSGELSLPGVSGGGSGDLSLFVLSPELKSSLCLGTVARGLKFCTKGKGVCSTGGHAKKIEVVEHDLYISTGRNSAFSNHHIPSSVLTSSQLGAILQERHTEEEWVRLLHAWNSKALEETKPSETPFTKVGALMVSTAVTPSRKRKPIYGPVEEDSIPGLSASSSSLSSPSSVDSDFELVPIAIDSVPPEEKLADVLSKWDTVVLNVNAMSGLFKKLRSTLGDDIENVQDRVNVVDSRIGARSKLEPFEDCLTTWEGLTYVQSGVTELAVSVTDCYGHLNSMADGNQREFDSIKSHINDQVNELKKNVQGVVELVDLIGEEHDVLLSRDHGRTAAAAPFPVKDEIDGLKLRLMQCESLLHNRSLSPHDTSAGGALFKEIQDLKGELRKVSARVPITGMLKLGGLSFQSREDVLVFVESKMPSNGYYFFHDAVTLLESLSGSFSEKKEVLNEYYQSQKVGVNAGEARHLASFRTTLPYVFGHEKDGVPHTSKHALPAVKSFKEWNPFDQDSGVMNFILQGIHDLKFQIPQDINNELGGEEFAEARRLALDMHSYSHFFVGEMCTWVTGFVQELTLQATEDEAWTLASQCLKSIFVYLRTVRSAAANAFSDPNKVSRCTTYMWCLLESHRLMKEFLDASFRNHPCIAPVITLHLFRTRVTKTSFAESIKRLEGRLNALEKNGAPKAQGKGGGKKGGETEKA